MAANSHVSRQHRATKAIVMLPEPFPLSEERAPHKQDAMPEVTKHGVFRL